VEPPGRRAAGADAARRRRLAAAVPRRPPRGGGRPTPPPAPALRQDPCPPARHGPPLILREVLGYRADEVAGMLDSTVESVTSALKRARAALQRRLPPAAEQEPPPAPDSPSEQAIVAKFVGAWESADVGALVALLTDDVFVS